MHHRAWADLVQSSSRRRALSVISSSIQFLRRSWYSSTEMWVIARWVRDKRHPPIATFAPWPRSSPKMTASFPSAVFGSATPPGIIGCTIETSEMAGNDEADGTT